ncbi:MAG TPA: hypothetical protein EYM67_04135 [Candidatus Poseidoniales archaeon]|nr:hypothetical protein [Candidatus Poseidoniales archaeon]
MDDLQLLSLTVLFAGLVTLALPLLARLVEFATERQSGDWLLLGLLLLFGSALVAALWALWAASTQSWLLWPVGGFTLLFRLASPPILLRALSQRLGPPADGVASTATLEQSVTGLAVVLGSFALLVPWLEPAHGMAMAAAETGLATAVAVFSFSQFYLLLFIERMREGQAHFAWVAGLLLGIGFMVLTPAYLPGFQAAFRTTSALGWFGAAALFHFGRQPDPPPLLRKLRWNG